MDETVEQMRATVFAAGRYTCTGCGRTNESGEMFHYRGVRHTLCKSCAAAYDEKERKELRERVREDESDEPVYTQNEDEVICPYCGYKFSDSWEFPDEGTTECSDCEREFSYGRNVVVTYSTSRIKGSGE